jgi:hypothetical protein
LTFFSKDPVVNVQIPPLQRVNPSRNVNVPPKKRVADLPQDRRDLSEESSDDEEEAHSDASAADSETDVYDSSSLSSMADQLVGLMTEEVEEEDASENSVDAGKENNDEEEEAAANTLEDELPITPGRRRKKMQAAYPNGPPLRNLLNGFSILFF